MKPKAGWHDTTTRILGLFWRSVQGTASPFLARRAQAAQAAQRVDTPNAWFYHCSGRRAPSMQYIPFLNVASWAAVVILLNLSLTVQNASAQKDLDPRAYVSDFAEVLSSSTKNHLTVLSEEVNQKAHVQIVVSTVKSLDGRSIADFSIDLAMQRGVGPAQSEPAVLILLAVDDRQYRFEVGQGLETVLPDSKTAAFGREAMPYLQRANYDAAVLLMSRRVAEVIAQERGIALTTPQPAPPPRRLVSEQEEKDYIRAALVFGALCLVLVLYAALRRASKAGSHN